MIRVENTYFKTAHDDPVRLISGRPLPDPKLGPYVFVDCDFHPAVKEELKRHYKTSKFVNCYGGGEPNY